jgi:mannobiose 2-epimerase
MNDLKVRVTRELMHHILPFWRTHGTDEEFGGFRGRVTNDLQVEKKAGKGLILNARILWFFAAVYRYAGDDLDYQLAQRADAYLKDYFLDKKYGGYYWMLHHDGAPAQEIKKLYGQAFVLYALSEFYQAKPSQSVLAEAKSLFELIESYYPDPENPGYLEAFDRNWQLADDMRLDTNDMNAAKSMNTHLHLLEAYTNFFRIHPDPDVKQRLEALIHIFLDKILDRNTSHLQLFFNVTWRSQSKAISYGHDIESTWLLCEAAEILHNPDLMERTRKTAVVLAQKILDEAIAADGGIAYEADGEGTFTDPDTHWWAQAEAVVGFFNAYQISRQKHFLHAAERCWTFIEKQISDHIHGGWFYKVTPGRKVVETEYKISEWKCPYHSGRACLELIRRLTTIGVQF